MTARRPLALLTLALAQYGVSQAVATLGTATTPDHAELLFRNAPDVYFCFDGDRAGRSAAWKALESVLPRMKDGRQAFFLERRAQQRREHPLGQGGDHRLERVLLAVGLQGGQEAVNVAGFEEHAQVLGCRRHCAAPSRS